jgi:hypothetical protein
MTGLAARPLALALVAMALASALPARAGTPELIRSAESAAPAQIAAKATVILLKADGSIAQLRKGTNNFTCLPDNPATPGPDPMCADANAMEWVKQWVAHKPPNQNKPGFM